MAAKLKPGQTLPLPFGPFLGQRDTLTPTGQKPEFATLMRNLWIQLTEDGAGAVARPGFQKLAKPATGEAQGLRYVGERPGTQEIIAVVGGGLYRYDLSGTTWTSNVKPAGVTINATGRVYMEWFANRLVVSDGVNRPWAFNPADGTGAYLTDMAQAAYGRPVVYGAKLFLIVSTSDRLTIAWSEENDVNTGFGVNRWTLGQTSLAPLVCLVPTNGQLFYFRESSIGAITGSVTPDFATASTHDSVSEELGTLSPDGAIVVEDMVYFLDQNGLPAFFQLGAKPKYLDGATRTLSDVNRGRLGAAFVAYLADVRAVAWGIALSSGSSLNNDLLLFSTETHNCWGTWGHQVSAGVDFKVGTSARDSAGRAAFAHLDQDGDFYLQRQKDQAASRYDTLVANILPEVELQTAWLGYDHDFLKVMDSVMLETIRDGGAGPTVTIDYQGSRDASWVPVAPLVAKAPDGQAPYAPSRIEVGTFSEGRYFRLRFRNISEPSFYRHCYLGGEARVFGRPATPGFG